MIHLTVHQVSAHIDGALVGTSLDLVVRHLTQCEACRSEFAALRAQDQVLARLIAHDPGDAWFDEFHEDLERALSGEAPLPRPQPEAGPEPEPDPEPSPIEVVIATLRQEHDMQTAPPVVPPIVPVTAAPRTPIVPRDTPGAPPPRVYVPRPKPAHVRGGGVIAGALVLLVVVGAGWMLAQSRITAQAGWPAIEPATSSAPTPAAPAPDPVVTAPPPPAASEPVAIEPAPAVVRTPEPAPAPRAISEPVTPRESAPRRVAEPPPARERTPVLEPEYLPPPEPVRAAPTPVRPTSVVTTTVTLPPPRSTPVTTPSAPPAAPKPAPVSPTPARASEPVAVITPAPRESAPAARPAAPATPAAALGLLCGQVRDEDGGAVVGAQVMMADAGVAVVTDRTGRFCVSAPVGERTVSVLAMGFKPMRRVVTVAPTGTDIAVTLPTGTPIAPGGAGTTPGAGNDPFAAIPAPLLENARAGERLAREALGVGSARLYDQSASEWERVIRGLGDGPERTEARARLAEARYRAWDLDPSPVHHDAALAAVEAFLAAAPSGARAGEARGWKARLAP